MKILFCCGGGFSSSTMVKHIQEELKKKKLDAEYSFTFCPFSLSAQNMAEHDLIVCCPHLSWQIKDYNKKQIKDRKPIYVLPIRQYGPVDVEELVMDLEDVMQIFANDPVNPVHFPGEMDALKVKRLQSFRHTYPDRSIFGS